MVYVYMHVFQVTVFVERSSDVSHQICMHAMVMIRIPVVEDYPKK